MTPSKAARVSSDLDSPSSLSINQVMDTLPAEKHEDSQEPTASALQRTISTLSRGSSRKDPGPPPNGGIAAWTQMLMGHLVVFNAWGFVSSYGSYQTYYSSTLGMSQSSLSWIGTLQIFLMFCVGAFSGRALDAGLFHYVFLPGVFFQLLGVFMTSISSTYWQIILAQGVAIGLGNGLMFAPAVGVVSTYFTTRRTFALACCAAGGGTGGLVFPAIFQQLLPRIGFGWTVRVTGFVMLFNHIFTSLLLRPRLPPRKTGSLVEWRAFTEPVYSCFIAGMFFSFWALYFGFFYVGSYARDILGMPQTASINLLLIVNGLSVPGRIVPAILSDWRFGPLNTIGPFVLACGILCYFWALVDTVPAGYIWSAFYGVANAGVQGLWPATLASLSPDPRFVGVRIGMGFTICSFATLTGSPLGGALVSIHNGNYLYAQIWAGTSMIVGFALLLAARFYATGPKLFAKV